MKRCFQLLMLSLIICCSMITCFGCVGGNFKELGQLTCTSGMTEKDPLVYYKQDVNYENRDEVLNTLSRPLGQGQNSCLFQCPDIELSTSFSGILSLGGVVNGWYVGKVTTTPQTMNLTYQGYTCKLYYIVVDRT